MSTTTPVGAIYLPDNTCRFTVWAPHKNKMTLHIVHPQEQKIAMQKNDSGYFSVQVSLQPHSRYYYMPDDEKDYPDPASAYQPEGVHGPSEIIDHNYSWTDQQWHGLPLEEYIIYEIHIGTFTEAGTFDAVIPYLDDLVDTGINAIEIMPVSQFPGKRNWGYDGAFPYAAQNSYGGPIALKKLVDACHSKGIAVILDVVYNHLGPEGNYLPVYAPYFTDKYCTPWGQAINYDGPWCDGVRNYFCNNALYWLRHFHIDALRLDAIHEMYDFGAIHFWELLHDAVNEEAQQAGRQYYLIAESDLNNPKIIMPPEAGGYGFNAQWLDDFHHALYVLLNAKARDNYIDFGSIEQLAKAYTKGFVHSGEYVMFRNKKFGRSSAGIPGNRFIVFNQNHDQVGNTADGSRLSVHVSFQALKIAAAAIMLAPYIPMLFMGEEYGEDNPFMYFIDHTDKELIDAVRKGRKKEFDKEMSSLEPADPENEATFVHSRINWEKRHVGKYNVLLSWNKALITLRKQHSALKNYDKDSISVNIINAQCFVLHRMGEDKSSQLLAIFNLSETPAAYTPTHISDRWERLLDAGSFTYNDDAPNLFPLSINTDQIMVPAMSVAIYRIANK